MKEPNFRAEANRLLSITNLPRHAALSEILASLVEMYSRGYEAGCDKGFLDGFNERNKRVLNKVKESANA